MSTSVGQFGNSGASLILNAGIQKLAQAQTQIAWQTSNNGIIASNYADLGPTRSTALNLAPKISQVAAWQQNITQAQSSLQITANALQQIATMAQNLSTNLLSMSGTTGSTETATTSYAEQAKSALGDLSSLLNTSDGTSYVFAGSASNEKPVSGNTPLEQSTLAASIASQMSSLTSSNAADVLGNMTTATNADTNIFSKTLTPSSPSATDNLNQANSLQKSTFISSGSTTQIGVVATQGNSSDVSDTSTGSPIKDLMRNLMAVSSMSGMSSSTPGYSDIVQQMHSSLTSTITQIVNMETTIGTQQNALSARASLLTSMQTSLQTQLANARSVDIAQVAVNSQDVNNSLKASYMLIADMKDMSLANYL